MRALSLVLFSAVVSCSLAVHGQAPPPPPLLAAPQGGKLPPPPPSHKANFDAERKEADGLYTSGNILESLPLYADLCQQDQTIAVFAERHGSGLLKQAATIQDPKASQAVLNQAMAELRRAQTLGDNSPLVQTLLSLGNKTPLGAILSGLPLTIGYSYHGSAAAQAPMHEAEAAFAHNDFAGAEKLYQHAAELDPAWYDAALYTGDCFFRLGDAASAGAWFARAIAIDPDRDTAYRYWGDALFKSGDRAGAEEKYILGFVAEPYSKPAFLQLSQWARLTGNQIVSPQVVRPPFKTLNGVLQPDPAMATPTPDGHAEWLIYQKQRVAHGGLTLNQPIVAGGSDANGVLTPNGYHHTLAEERDSLRIMLDDIRDKQKSGELVNANLEPSLRNLLALERDSALREWVLLNAADAGIRLDYPAFRDAHRDLLVRYVQRWMIRPAVQAQTAPAQ